ncbi:metal-dependent membrane protease [Lacticaseibacillus rhamnosus MTCC 5462]|nr:metal-dependent membrane protease [Lacticaseibacillus rhamnosus MTCC 5462]
MGGYNIHIVFDVSNLIWLPLFLFGFSIQSMFEELLCRGYVMGYWIKEKRPVLAVIINSILFLLYILLIHTSIGILQWAYFYLEL